MAVSGGGALPLPHPAALTGPRPFPPARGSPRTSAVTWPERGGGERREAAPDVTPPPPQDRRKNEASPPSPPASRASTLGSYPQRHAAGHRRGGVYGPYHLTRGLRRREGRTGARYSSLGPPAGWPLVLFSLFGISPAKPAGSSRNTRPPHTPEW